MQHHSVLLDEVIDWFDLRKRRSIIDATLGLGGHSAAIFEHPEFGGTVIGIDQDQSHLDKATQNLKVFSDRFRPESMNFSDLETFLVDHDIHFDAVLFDLGVASPHLDFPERGFSFQHDGPLDMRMDQRGPLTAEIILNTYGTDTLTFIFRNYGEERLAPKIARAIIRERFLKPFRRTLPLAELIVEVYRRSGLRSSHKHPATKVFQALRIAVNAELEALQKALLAALDHIDSGGRIIVISYHSLEDRIVKQFFQQAVKPCVCPPQLPVCACQKKPRLRILTKRPIVPSEQEIRSNPRARSAKMRVAEKI